MAATKYHICICLFSSLQMAAVLYYHINTHLPRPNNIFGYCTTFYPQISKYVSQQNM